jgi:amylosucrase
MTAGWAALAEQDAGLVRAVVDGTPALPPGTSWLTYVRCHDDIGWKHLLPEAGSMDRLVAIADFYNGPSGFAAGVPFQGGLATNGTAAALCGLQHARTEDEVDHAIRRLLLLHALALAYGGLPMLYMGDELGMLNDDGYLADPARAHDSRWVQRAAFPAGGRERRHAAAGASARIHAGLCELVALRRQHPDLAAGTACVVLDTPDPALLALARGTRFLGLFNFSERGLAVDLRVFGAAGTVTLRPWDVAWLDRVSGARIGSGQAVPA